MTKKLNCILLIDDNDSDNFIHERVIKKCDCARQVVSLQGGQLGIDYLRAGGDAGSPKPDLIFLDINMPGVDGWDFLELYDTLDESQKGHVVIIMLTTSLNPDDEEKAKKINSISDFINKPLTADLLEELLDRHFGA